MQLNAGAVGPRPRMDCYTTFRELTKREKRGRDFRVRWLARPSPWLVIAPHGGGIEPGTSEIAEAIAADDLSLYAFEGIKPRENARLHITSTRFDEPRCTLLLEASRKALSVHGKGGREQLVLLGGRDVETLERLRRSLERRRFRVEIHPGLALEGRDRANVCNRCGSGMGVQLEMSHGLRRSLFRSLSARGRGVKTARFWQLVAGVREGVTQRRRSPAGQCATDRADPEGS